MRSAEQVKSPQNSNTQSGSCGLLELTLSSGLHGENLSICFSLSPHKYYANSWMWVTGICLLISGLICLPETGHRQKSFYLSSWLSSGKWTKSKDAKFSNIGAIPAHHRSIYLLGFPVSWLPNKPTQFVVLSSTYFPKQGHWRPLLVVSCSLIKQFETQVSIVVLIKWKIFTHLEQPKCSW